jgi:membrane protein implicated in regulation of membrane protease activity
VPVAWRVPRGFWAYLLLQIPDILLAGLILLLLHWWVGLSLEWALGLFALWVLTNLAMYPLLRDVFAPPRFGPETLIAARTLAREPLAPRGYILLRGELWRAETLRPQEAIAPGTVLTVRARRGLTLLVEAEGSVGDSDRKEAVP